MSHPALRLGVNIDHVATVRNARGGAHPDPLRALALAVQAGADGITAHLREDRRHITDADIRAIADACRQHRVPLNFEMAVTDEMTAIALEIQPHAACLVPEKREERTTEGGLDVVRFADAVGANVETFNARGIRSSLFIEADAAQIREAARLKAPVIEIHTGAYCDAVREGHAEAAQDILARLMDGAALAHDLGIEVHAGHGIDYQTVAPLCALPGLRELNIGHFLIGEAIFVGLDVAIAGMRARMREAYAQAQLQVQGSGEV